MKEATRRQRDGRATERKYSSTQLQRLVKEAEIVALQGTQRMDIREKQYQSKQKNIH